MLAGETPNGTVTYSSGTYTLAGTSNTVNIFDLTTGSFSGNTINITAPAGSTVVVNVAGTADSFTGGSINLKGVSTNDVIFNFNAATSLSLASIGFNGSILAPYADFNGNYGQIDGELIASSAEGTTEIDNPVFNGNLGSTPSNQVSGVPEPSTWVMLLAGIAALAVGKIGRNR